MNRICILILLLSMGCADQDGSTSDNLTGKGGSVARFALGKTHLYTVDDETLHVFQLNDDGGAVRINKVSLGAGVETIATREDWLYIGTNQSMLIYDISRPAMPAYVSTYTHFLGCDPVVVQDTLAYVTLRTNGCGNNTINTLDIINIKDAAHPVLVSNYTLESPYGLGIDGSLLFVCEGERGMKVLDVTDPFNARILKNYDNVRAYDVIANNGILVMTGANGIIQYDYSDVAAIRELSFIAIE